MSGYLESFPAPMPAEPGFTIYASQDRISIQTNEEGYLESSVQVPLSIFGNSGGASIPSTITAIRTNDPLGEITGSILTATDAVITFLADANFNNQDTGNIELDVVVQGATFTKFVSWVKIRPGKKSWALELAQGVVPLSANSDGTIKDFSDTVSLNVYNGSQRITQADIDLPISGFINTPDVPYNPNPGGAGFVGQSNMQVYVDVDPWVRPYVSFGAGGLELKINITGAPMIAPIIDAKIKIKYFSKYYGDELNDGSPDPAPTQVTLVSDLNWICTIDGWEAVHSTCDLPCFVVQGDEFGFVNPQDPPPSNPTFRVDVGTKSHSDFSLDIAGATFPPWLAGMEVVNPGGSRTILFSYVSGGSGSQTLPFQGAIEIPVNINVITSDGSVEVINRVHSIPFQIIKGQKSVFESNIDLNAVCVLTEDDVTVPQSQLLLLRTFKNDSPHVALIQNISYDPPISAADPYDWLTISYSAAPDSQHAISIVVNAETITGQARNGKITITSTARANNFNADTKTFKNSFCYSFVPKGDKGDTGGIGGKGDKGDTGAGLAVLSPIYNAQVDLEAAHPTANDGDAYFVGLSHPYDLYIWTGSWVNTGKLQGPQGRPGEDGKDGKDGKDGANGINGLTTSVNGVQQVNGVVNISAIHIPVSPTIPATATTVQGFADYMARFLPVKKSFSIPTLSWTLNATSGYYEFVVTDADVTQADTKIDIAWDTASLTQFKGAVGGYTSNGSITIQSVKLPAVLVAGEYFIQKVRL